MPIMIERCTRMTLRIEITSGSRERLQDSAAKVHRASCHSLALVPSQKRPRTRGTWQLERRTSRGGWHRHRPAISDEWARAKMKLRAREGEAGETTSTMRISSVLLAFSQIARFPESGTLLRDVYGDVYARETSGDRMGEGGGRKIPIVAST